MKFQDFYQRQDIGIYSYIKKNLEIRFFFTTLEENQTTTIQLRDMCVYVKMRKGTIRKGLGGWNKNK
jgi:hypothetical protein